MDNGRVIYSLFFQSYIPKTFNTHIILRPMHIPALLQWGEIHITFLLLATLLAASSHSH